MKHIRTCAKAADKITLMADNHVGYGVPIGGVATYRNAISPAGVGYDIGCGNKVDQLDMTDADLRLNIGRIMDEISDAISFGVGRRNPVRMYSASHDFRLFMIYVHYFLD